MLTTISIYDSRCTLYSVHAQLYAWTHATQTEVNYEYVLTLTEVDNPVIFLHQFNQFYNHNKCLLWLDYSWEDNPITTLIRWIIMLDC